MLSFSHQAARTLDRRSNLCDLWSLKNRDVSPISNPTSNPSVACMTCLSDYFSHLCASYRSLTSIYVHFHEIFVQGSDEGSFFMILMKFHSSTRNKRDDNFITNIEYSKCYSNTEIQTALRNCTRFFFLSISPVKFSLPDDVRGSKRTNCFYTNSTARWSSIIFISTSS
jgi:hypothetical protein